MGKSLRAPLRKALELATDTMEGVAAGMGRTPRLLRFYLSGDRRVTPAAACALAAYLRQRARTFNEAADELDAAANREERGSR
ncbi:MAG: hypothetical protein ACREK5_10725 [Gemmatimonadota bacterium]